MQSQFVTHELPNGLRIICEVVPGVRSAAVGFLARTGARDEAPAMHGVSHFLEHMCFKGTPARTWHDINVRFDELGSIYNAFTGKEYTAALGKAMDTLYDYADSRIFWAEIWAQRMMDINSAMFFAEDCCSSLSRVGSVIPLSDS